MSVHTGLWCSAKRQAVGLPLKIAIVSDAKFLGESLAQSLSVDNRLCVQGSFQNWSEALSSVETETLDMVLLDSGLREGPSAVKLLRGAAPCILIVVIALSETAQEVIAWAEAGVSGYVTKHEALCNIGSLLVRIANGEQSCSSSVAASLLRHISGQRASGSLDSPSQLTSREVQIVELLAAGMSNKDIARRLNIGLPTAKTHVHHVLGKLHFKRRAQAADWIRGQS